MAGPRKDLLPLVQDPPQETICGTHLAARRTTLPPRTGMVREVVAPREGEAPARGSAGTRTLRKGSDPPRGAARRELDAPAEGTPLRILAANLMAGPAGTDVLMELVARVRPDVPAGDFNATLDRLLVRELLASGHRDAAEVTGQGLHATWPQGGWGPLPGVALDRVPADARIGVRSFGVHTLKGTGHHPVSAVPTLPGLE